MKTCIIGYGKAGYALAKKLYELGILDQIISESQKISQIIKEFPTVHISTIIEDISFEADFYIIAKNESYIEQTSMRVAKLLQEKLKEKKVIHLSGSLSSEVLIECKNYGAKTASVHPYQTFYMYDDDIFEEVGWGIETKDEFDEFDEFVKLTGGHGINISTWTKEKKTLYHASAVVASNIMTAIIQTAKEIASIAEINSQDFFPAILRQTLKNNISMLDKDNMPLTGPIPRKEIDILKSHAINLLEDIHLQSIYIELVIASIRIAERNNILAENDSRIMINELDRIRKERN